MLLHGRGRGRRKELKQDSFEEEATAHVRLSQVKQANKQQLQARKAIDRAILQGKEGAVVLSVLPLWI